MLIDYFPKPLRHRFSEPMHRHPLRREILATYLTNALVNRVGCEFVHRLMEETDARPGEIVRACIMARDVFDLDEVWRSIDALDNRVADDVQARMFVEVARLVERAALWFLRQLQSGAVSDVTDLLTRCRDAAQRLASQWPALLPTADLEALSERQRILVDAGVDSELAVRVASGEISAAVLDIAEVAAKCGKDLERVAGVYFALGTLLNYGWIGEGANIGPCRSNVMRACWPICVRRAVRASLYCW
jgi:glutamate dehydrogenase